MKILSLQSENVKRIQVVQITPDGHLVVIGGQNAQGKTSILDSITMALAGGKTIPAAPIRKGQKAAEITLDLGELLVIRKFSAQAGPSLVVKGADGVKITSPQALLDKLTAKISFDPLAFTRMDPRDQANELRKLVGLDFSTLDAERAKHYNERTVKNREVDMAQHKVRTAQHFPNAPTATQAAEELLAKLQEANDHNTAISNAQAALEPLARECERTAQVVRDAEEALKAAQAALKSAKEADAEACRAYKDAEKATKGAEPIDTAELSQKIADISNVNAQVQANAARAVLIADLRKLEGESKKLTDSIEAIDSKKAALLAEAKFPVEGLGFDDDGTVTFNAMPFSQASAAEQLRVSVAMGIGMNPKLKVLLIRDGSLLDETNLALIGKMAEEHDAQVWIERVGDGKEVSVVIEDGRVKEDRTAAGKQASEALKLE